MNFLVILIAYLLIFGNIKLCATDYLTIEYNLTLDPSGPVSLVTPVLILRHKNKRPMVLTCNSIGNDSITWDVPPVLNFGELENPSIFNGTVLSGKLQNDINHRMKIDTTRNDNGFTSILHVWKLTLWDEGYYTCRSTSNPYVRARLYLFVMGMRRRTLGKDELPNTIRDVDPLKNYYVVNHQPSSAGKQSLIISYLNDGQSAGKYSETVLQRKTENGSWQLVDGSNGRIRNWNGSHYGFNRYYGIELYFSEKDEGTYASYRCISLGHGKTSGKTGEAFSILIEESPIKNNSAPIIRPSVKYLIFQPGATFNLTCESRSKGVKTIWEPEIRAMLPNEPKRRNSNTWKNMADGRIVNIFTVSNATVSDIGYYNCYNIEQNSGNYTVLSKQFIFIKDLNTLMTFNLYPYYPIESRYELSRFYTGFINNKALIALRYAPFVVRIRPSSPLVDMILYREISGGRRVQIYPALPGSKEENWSFDMFDGFKLQNVTWETTGNYIVEGLYVMRQLPIDKSDISSPKDKYIDKRYTFLFSIEVEGVEVVPSDPQLVRGKPFSLICRWKEPMFSSVIANKQNSMKAHWSWTPQQENGSITQSKTLGLYNISFIKEDVLGVFPYSVMRFSSDSLEQSGTYTCTIHYQFNCGRPNSRKKMCAGNYSSSHTLKIQEPRTPSLVGSSSDIEYLYVDPGNLVVLSCQVDAMPSADVIWKNSQGLSLNDGVYKSLDGFNTSFTFRATSNFSSEEFTCNFNNFVGATSKKFIVSLNGLLNAGHYTGIGIAVILILTLLLAVVRIIYLIRKRDMLVRMNRENLLKGESGQILNPESPLEEQVSLLPYDFKWEFPQNRLLFNGKRLGVGNFGIVVQAKAIGTVHDPNDSKVRTVAVKMVKSKCDPVALKSLATELKILIHLGPHLNVVNLLGACTKEIRNGNLLVIEEFCCYGNLHDYLVSNRLQFVNQLQEYGNLRTRHESIESLDSDGYLKDLREGSSKEASHNFRCPLQQPSNEREFTESIFRTLWYRDIILSDTEDDNALQEGPNGNLVVETNALPMTNLMKRDKSETKENNITTRDLICWSYQITRGMGHLESKKVIHGDLATRNILLSDGNVLKIADFGLSRQISGIYTKDKYSEEGLPIKWMAIESLTDRMFSTQSDVWSYGVLLWEIFSLGQIPYGDLHPSELTRFLQDGKRLRKPLFAPNAIFDLMTQCWEKEPKERPNFSIIERKLREIIEDKIQHRYLELVNNDAATSLNVDKD